LHPDLRGLVTDDTGMLPMDELDDGGAVVPTSAVEPRETMEPSGGLFDFEDQ